MSRLFVEGALTSLSSLLIVFVVYLASIVRQRVVNFMRQHFQTVEEAEDFYGLDVVCYMSDVSAIFRYGREMHWTSSGIPRTEQDKRNLGDWTSTEVRRAWNSNNL